MADVVGIATVDSGGRTHTIDAGQKTAANSLPVVLASDQAASGLTSVTATIANGASLSGAVSLAGAGLLRILMPAAWTAAALTFQVSPDDGTYYDLYGDDGVEYSVTVAAARAVTLDVTRFVGISFLKVRSGTASAAVNQGGSRALLLVTRPLA
jgi:hypothetical protein